MTTKIDRSDLERRARAAEQSIWTTPNARGRIPEHTSQFAIVYADGGEQVADAYDNTGWSDDQCFANAEHIAAASPPVVLALIAELCRLETGIAACDQVNGDSLTRIQELEVENAKLEAIAKAATAFVDEQGKYINAHNELTASANFAGEEWQALVAAVWAAGR